jgi:hypothetical protein
MITAGAWRQTPSAGSSAAMRPLCEQQGPAVCQILGMTKTGELEGEVAGQLEMAVATRQARGLWRTAGG